MEEKPAKVYVRCPYCDFTGITDATVSIISQLTDKIPAKRYQVRCGACDKHWETSLAMEVGADVSAGSDSSESP